LKYDARYVLDWTDHVWTEVYSERLERWYCNFRNFLSNQYDSKFFTSVDNVVTGSTVIHVKLPVINHFCMMLVGARN